MPPNTGHDPKTRAKFKITGIDEINGLVLLHHAKDGWIENPEAIRAMPCIEFVRNLMADWYELHRTKDPNVSR